MRNILIVISGPSGVGKGTIAKRLIERHANLDLSISCTTRAPRDGEIDGKEYFFISHDEFNKKIEENDFLEYSEHFGNFYGTPKKHVLNELKRKDIILEIDVNGGINVKKSHSDTVLIFIMPPSIDELKRRLVSRSTETDEEIKTRLDRLDYELDKKSLYDYAVINNNLDDAIAEVEKIIEKEKNK